MRQIFDKAKNNFQRAKIFFQGVEINFDKAKNFLALSLVAGALFGVSSCTSEPDDLFDKSASERLQSELNTYQALLVKPANGWAMEYYPGGSSQTFGGVALTVKFNSDGTVVVGSAEVDDVTATAKSTYNLTTDGSAGLSFNTYNDILHYYTDSDKSIGMGVAKGMFGDFEFIFESHTDNEIVMTGKRHHSIIRLYPLEGTSAEYLTAAKAQLKAFEDIPAKQSITGTFEGTAVTGAFISDKSFLLVQGDDAANVPFMFTDKGFKLYRSITLNGKTVSELTWNSTTKTLTSPDGNTVLTIVTDPLGLPAADMLGTYTMTYTSEAGSRTTNVTIGIDANSGNTVLKGLPFDIILTYNNTLGAYVIHPQYLDDAQTIVVAMYDHSAGYLSWSEEHGLVLRWDGASTTNLVLKGIDNGAWVGNTISGLIIWKKGTGSYTGYGASRYYDITLTKQ